MTMTGIISQFAEEAAFLYALRGNAVGAPHFSLKDLSRLDERLEAQIDGLRIAGDAGWDVCRHALDGDDAEGIFAAAILAIETGTEARIAHVMDAVKHDQIKSRPLISALGWLNFQQAGPLIARFLASQSPFHRYLGIAASAIHRHDPGHHLQLAASDPAPFLKVRALRAYGELGRSRELNLCNLRDDLRADDDGVRFYAAWAAALAGTTETVEILRAFAVPASPYQEKALNMALRRMKHVDALCWQKHLAQSPGTVRLAILGTGIIGDSALVPWLMEQMKTPELARVAGEAFTMITGVDIARDDMKGSQPEGFEAGPNDDPRDDKVTMDVDRDLPWPSPELVISWWDKNKGDYPSGVRYLLGKPIDSDQLRHVLKTGYQRQRSAAALELAMKNPGQPLFEVRAPAFRQKIEDATNE